MNVLKLVGHLVGSTMLHLDLQVGSGVHLHRRYLQDNILLPFMLQLHPESMIVLVTPLLILFLISSLLLPWPYPSLANPDLKLLFPFFHYDLVLGILMVLVFTILLDPQQDLLENIGVKSLIDATTHPVTRKRILLEEF